MNQQLSISRVYFVASLLLVLLVGFVVGTRSNQLFAVAAPLFGVKVETSTLDDASLQQAYQTLRANYNGKVSKEDLIEGAKHGMVSAVGDPYTMYFTQKEAEEFNKELSGDIGAGIGAEIGVRSGQPTVLRTLADNPAQKAGLHAGDVVLAVNDESADGWSAERAVRAIRGKKGTTVKLIIMRGKQTKEFTITRDTIKNPSVASDLRGDTGIITISRFDEETVALVRKAVDSLKSRGMKKLVVDMRGNGGGYLDAAPNVAGMWLKDKLVVSVRANNASPTKLMSKGDQILAGVKTAVVVNAGSASATEIVVGALRDYKAAIIVGEKTYGKGSVQELIPLTGGSMLKVTIQRWYTPKNQNVTGKGIKPDVAVELKQADIDAGRDPQLDKAIEAVNR